MADAPGWPGITPRWTSSAKSGVGTALSPLSRVWLTLSHGILNEIYYPRVDQACTRDFGLIVTDGVGFFAEEKRDTVSDLSTFEDGVPAFDVVNTHMGGRFRIHKQILTDPRRDTVLQRIRLENLGPPGLRGFVLLAPHLVNGGANNTAWLGRYKGREMLFATGQGSSLALAASRPFLARSVGFVGASDGWRILATNYRLDPCYDRAVNGNVALCAELDRPEDELVLALGFGTTHTEAAYRAVASLQEEFGVLAEEYAAIWRGWQSTLHPLDRMARAHNAYRVSTAVIRTHESPSFPGGLIASLSIPWGFSKGDDDLGGYHLVWPRDLVQSAGALLAAGAQAEARRVLEYLRAVQEPDGHWNQNSWLDGMPYWGALQLDETALPILLTDLAWRSGALHGGQREGFWPMVRAAAGFLLRRGPVTEQDRWEENAGYSPYTLAAQIAALLAAADLADLQDQPSIAALLRDTADCWNAAIEDWTVARNTPLAQAAGVSAYYVRIAPPRDGLAASDLGGRISIRNRADGQNTRPVAEVVSPDALALVRFGLRDPADPLILATMTVIDHVLKVDLPQGPLWRRYTGDGYGEHENGAPFNGTGIGRPWPLLTGERAHVVLAAGNQAEARRLLETFEESASAGFMLPEQVWDAADIPARELVHGGPSGSAMPLVWAHAEYVKLLRSLADGAVFDMPPQTVRRYRQSRTPPRCTIWRPDWRAPTLACGRALRIDLPAPGFVHWTVDEWATVTDTPTTETGLGFHAAELPTSGLRPGSVIRFTWHDTTGWAGQDHQVAVTDAGEPGPDQGGKT